MLKRFAMLVLVCVLGWMVLGTTPPVLGGELSGREIMDRTRALDLVEDMTMELEMRIINRRGQQRVRALTMSSLRTDDGADYSLMRFNSPADVRGTGFLNMQHPDGSTESWLYLPALGRERRMASDERGGSFMGSDFTVEDISLSLDDYLFTLTETTTLSGTDVYVVEALPATEEIKADVGFARRLYYVCTERFATLQNDVLDDAGNMIRVMTSADFVEVIDGLWVPRLSEMQNVEANTRTELVYDNIQVNTGLSTDDFSRRQLTRSR